MSLKRIEKVLREPKLILPAMARRVAPHSQFGPSFILRPDGYVTFRSAGFVSAPSAEALLARHNHEVSLIRKVLRNVNVERSLEVGCGFGRLSPWFGEHARTVVAIDLNEAALKSAVSSYEEISFIRAVGDKLPFPDGSFGLVSTWTVLQHVRPERIVTTANELLRTLSPGGHLLLCEETRHTDRVTRHTWHRPLAFYATLFESLSLQWHSYIDDIDRLPGMESPGQVMLFGCPNGVGK
jgi:SAM-dependent methyltransferase